MNDDFFSKFRQSPRPEFSQSLYTKLVQGAKGASLINRHSTAKQIAFALAVLCLLFVAVSPATARVVVENIIAKITVRGVTVFVSDEPLPVPTGESESYSVIWTPLSPHDISVDYPFFAMLPTWVPDGYVLQERAALYYGAMYDVPPGSALFEWKDNTGETIQLEVMKGSCLNGTGLSQIPTSDCTLSIYISVGPESEPQVIAVNSQPAVLFCGVGGIADLSGSVRKWNPSNWKPTKDVTKGAWMTWENAERTFMLVSTSQTITKEDLLRLAESIP